jgi:hypothetical protein
MQNKLLGQVMCRALIGSLLLVAAPALRAQDTDQGTYQGPGISSPGVGNIGSRSGEQVDLRYYIGISGVVDGSNTPFQVDAKGNLVRLPYLYGIEVAGGAYGVHSWKRSQLALDYAGGYTRFLNSDAYSSLNHALSIGYTDQLSRRLRLDVRESLGSLTYGTGQVANAASSELNTSFTPATRLFDTRTYYLQSSASATYLQSARTSFTAGAGTYLQTLKSTGLANGWGYSLNASMMRRMSKSVTLGVTYLYSHFEYPEFSSKADSHALQALYATSLGRFWTLSLEAGATFNKGQSLLLIPVDPVLAAVLGQSTITGIAHFQTLYPSGTVSLNRQFRRASLGLHYYRGVNSGNGTYNTGILDNATATVSYTGRKVNLGADGGYYKLKSLGQQIGRFTVYSAGAGLTYALGRDLHLSLRYDYRDQLIDLSTYRQKGSRATLGLNFSPGGVPLSLW